MTRAFVFSLMTAFIIVTVLGFHRVLKKDTVLIASAFLFISSFLYAVTENAALSLLISLTFISICIVLSKLMNKYKGNKNYFAVLAVDYSNNELTVTDFRTVYKVKCSDSQNYISGGMIVINNSNLI